MTKHERERELKLKTRAEIEMGSVVALLNLKFPTNHIFRENIISKNDIYGNQFFFKNRVRMYVREI